MWEAWVDTYRIIFANARVTMFQLQEDASEHYPAQMQNLLLGADMGVATEITMYAWALVREERLRLGGAGP